MLAMLTAGGLLVAALVVWALTRTVEPESATPTTGGEVATMPSPSPEPLTNTALSTTLPTATATTPPPPQPQGDRSAVKRIAAEDVRAKLDRGEVTIVDVRDASAYAREHIAGAVNIPFATVEGQIDTLPKGKTIITYCT